MRGLWKATALLSSLSTSAAIVPRSLPTKYEEALDFVTKYSKYQGSSSYDKLKNGDSHPPPDESEASVVFRVSEPIAPGVHIPVCRPCTPCVLTY